jgi:hypothetical protein
VNIRGVAKAKNNVHRLDLKGNILLLQERHFGSCSRFQVKTNKQQ